MPDRSFEPRLESMRGIAALIVAISHSMAVFQVAPSEQNSIIGWFLGKAVNPGFAVMFFFVLSGYVLGRSFERDPHYLRFLIRRAFRLLPVFIVSVLFAFACVSLIRLHPMPHGISSFFARPFWPAPTIRQLQENLTFQSSWVDGPTWSIFWEVAGSIYLPSLILIHRLCGDRHQTSLFLALSCFLLLVRIGQLPLLNIAEYFYAGYFLPPIISRFLPKSWLLRFFVFGAGYWLGLSGGLVVADKSRAIIESSIGCSLMIGAIVSSGDFLSFLCWRPLRFVGRVSYSFYLLHWPLLYVTTIVLLPLGVAGEYGNWTVCIASVSFALIVGACSHRWLELSSIALGKYVASLVRLPCRQLAR